MSNPDRCFIDTSALIALLNPRDQYHASMRSYLREREDGLRGTTSNLVLGELLTFFSRHGTLRVVLNFQREFLADRHSTVIWVDRELHERASDLLPKFADRQLSFTDAASFAIMKREGITQALAFDDDFAHAGFIRLP